MTMRVNTVRRNVSWPAETEKLVKQLAFERGMAVSHFLAQLAKVEREDARVYPETDMAWKLSPGLQRALDRGNHRKGDKKPTG